MALRSAGIVIIGNEILSGAVRDENIFFLCQRFQELGIKVNKIVTVGDEAEDIAEEVSEFSNNLDLVITCGGVGPTHDDVTYEGVASAFGLRLELNDELLMFWKEGSLKNDTSFNKMSFVPKSSKLIYAELPDRCKAPIVVVRNVYMFPGSPQLLQSRFIAIEKEYFGGNGYTFYKREIFLCVDETAIVSSLNETVNLFKDVTIGSYPEIDNPDYSTRITLHSYLENKVNEAYDMLTSLIEPFWILDPNNFVSGKDLCKSKI